MSETNMVISEIDKEKLISILTEELPVLRAKIGLSQDELSNIIGISRQTYSTIERKKRKMTWNMFLSFILFFNYNDKTSDLLDKIGVFPEWLHEMLNVNERNYK